MNEFSRTALLFDEEQLSNIQHTHIAMFGLGGVGGHCIESLVRCGVKEVSLYDFDTITLTNLNRQIIALHSTLNQGKCEAMKKRLLDINPNLIVHTYPIFIDKDTISTIDFQHYDYMIDAIDTVSAKLLLIEKAKEYNIPIICSMGTGNKLDPTQLQIMDISKTKYCPLAKVMRKELKNRRINKLKVLSSFEKPLTPRQSDEVTNKRMVIGSTSFVPSVAGILICREVIMDVMNKKSQ